jgi:hypothetical protein
MNWLDMLQQKVQLSRRQKGNGNASACIDRTSKFTTP